MIDEGDYGDDTKIPYNKISLYTRYYGEFLVVDFIYFGVLEDFDGETYHFENNMCLNEDDMLLCHNKSDSEIDSNILKDEIKISYAYEMFTSIDIEEVIKELQREFSVSQYEEISFQYRINAGEDIIRYGNIVFYYNNEFHYDDLYTPDELVLELRVFFMNESGTEGEMVVAYSEIE